MERLERYEIISGDEARSKIVSMLKSAETGCLALFDEKYPYIIPLNHVFDNDCLLLHGSFVGKKIDLMKKNAYASYEIDYPVDAPKVKVLTCHREYESVILNGKIDLIEDPEKRYEYLKRISDEYSLPFKHGGEERCNVFIFRIHRATARTGRFTPAGQKLLYSYDFVDPENK